MLEQAHDWHLLIKWTHLHLTMDMLVFQHGCIHFSSRTRPLKSPDASAVPGGCIQSELHLRPSKIWTHSAFAIDTLGMFWQMHSRVRTASTISVDISRGTYVWSILYYNSFSYISYWWLTRAHKSQKFQMIFSPEQQL